MSFDEKEEKEKEEGSKVEDQHQELPPINFVSFVLSLAAEAQVHMGLYPDPSGGKVEKKIILAKQTIDLLGLLEEKTKGNLESEEAEVLKEVLHHLRLQFLEVNK